MDYLLITRLSKLDRSDRTGRSSRELDLHPVRLVLKNDLQENWEKTAKSGDPAGPGGSCGFFFYF
jgi:hypothetical protein